PVSSTETADTALHALSLHDALPISAELALREHARHLVRQDRLGLVGIDAALEVDELLVRTLRQARGQLVQRRAQGLGQFRQAVRDRKSTRLNSSHVKISYAVFCLKK